LKTGSNVIYFSLDSYLQSHYFECTKTYANRDLKHSNSR